jgi:hypothetical protein
MSDRDPLKIAQFLRETASVSKDKMGEFFGVEKELN